MKFYLDLLLTTAPEISKKNPVFFFILFKCHTAHHLGFLLHDDGSFVHTKVFTFCPDSRQSLLVAEANSSLVILTYCELYLLTVKPVSLVSLQPFHSLINCQSNLKPRYMCLFLSDIA